MTDTPAILPCPFCGGDAIQDWDAVVDYYGHEHQNTWIKCKSCHGEMYMNVYEVARGGDADCSCCYDVGQLCRDKWNRRAIIEQQQQPNVLVSELRKSMKGLSENDPYLCRVLELIHQAEQEKRHDYDQEK